MENSEEHYSIMFCDEAWDKYSALAEQEDADSLRIIKKINRQLCDLAAKHRHDISSKSAVCIAQVENVRIRYTRKGSRISVVELEETGEGEGIFSTLNRRGWDVSVAEA